MINILVKNRGTKKKEKKGGRGEAGRNTKQREFYIMRKGTDTKATF